MKHRKSFPIVLLLLVSASLIISSCSVIGFRRIRGSGNVISEIRQVSDFHAIDLRGSGELFVTQGDTESLEIEAEDNLMKYLESEVVNGTLHLGYDPGLRLNLAPTQTIRYTLTVINLDEIEISGSGRMTAGSLESEDLTLEASGSGEFVIEDLAVENLFLEFSGSAEAEIAGTSPHQEIRISGSGEYNGEDLASQTVEVDISGSGNVTLWVTDALDIRVSGSGEVDYYGSPVVNQNVSGSGEITSLGEK